jgi:hypothetical protein
MRDGTTLYANVYRPDTQDKYPAVITRLPYNKDLLFAERGGGYMNPQRLVRAGYAVVIQDCRGTGASEGEWYPHRLQQEDGYDTVEWVAAQPWCDGNVAMYGASCLGYVQWATAVAQPPHLKTVCPSQIFTVFRGSSYRNAGGYSSPQGVLFNKTITALQLIWIQDALMKSKRPPEELKPLMERCLHINDNIDEYCSFLPLKDNPVVELARELNVPTFYSDQLEKVEDEAYMEQDMQIRLDPEKVNVPVFCLTGWYDMLTSGTIENYKIATERGKAGKVSKLLVGPWLHGSELSSSVGELDFGGTANGAFIDVCGMHIRWFDYWLKGINNGITEEPPVRIFVLGDNVWRDENEWPLARTKYTKYYLHSGGRANSRFGNGVLSTEIPGEEETDAYLYDPRNPVPIAAEKGGFGELALGYGVADQQKVEERSDVLVYTSEPLKTDLEVTGPIVVKLWAASSAVDTDFTGKLVDVWPDGRAYNLANGVVRARHRQSVAKPTLLEPGKVYEFSIDLGATSNVFKAGHRIRLEVSSSFFPRYDRNLNTGHPVGQDSEIKVAAQTIYHDKQHPSHIMMPVIPR